MAFDQEILTRSAAEYADFLLPHIDNHFDVCPSHSVLEALEHPLDALIEMKRVMKRGGVIGVVSVEYGGVILAGEDIWGRSKSSDI